MFPPNVTVVVPTLAADASLTECLRSLELQSSTDFAVIVVDNSGCGRARTLLPPKSTALVIENDRNAGFGTAVNQGIKASKSAFIATINDDAVADREWIASLLRGIDARPDIGMCASRVKLQNSGHIDSTGMLIAADGSSKQRGHGEDFDRYAKSGEALFPAGSAALYRRAMLDQIGGFDDDFFLYCEDTDLGLRALWAGWRCLYVADAIVEHRYSHSAGRASALKAYYVERNRLFVALKNFPLRMLPGGLLAAVERYVWHFIYMRRGEGKAAEYAENGSAAKLAWFVLRAHLSAIAALPELIAKRRGILSRARMSPRDFTRLLHRHWITPRQVAAH